MASKTTKTTKTTKAPAKKVAAKKAPAKKAKPAVAKPTPAKATDSSKETISAKELMETKAIEKGIKIEDMITRREVTLKSVDEFMGLPAKQNYSNRPVIPGVFDLLIPPGTPRKLIIKLAKEHNLQMVRRDDIYVPVGVCDIERDLLAIRGDEKTIRKLEKVLYKEIEDYINGKDARLHDYAKTPRLEGISGPAHAKKPKAKARSK